MKQTLKTKKGVVGALLVTALAFSSLVAPVQSHAAITPKLDYLISKGGYTTFAMKKDGSTVYSVGSNSYGALGDQSGANNKTSPTTVNGLYDVAELDAGESHYVALKNDGTVWSWGWSGYGELGTGNKSDSARTPVQNIWLSDVKEVRAGDYFTVVLKNDGTVWTYGQGDQGQLGNGLTGASNYLVTPYQVPGLSNVVSIEAGEDTAAALKADGTMWVWGNNVYGQMGDGTTVDASTPKQYPVSGSVKGIALGGGRTYAIMQNGDVYGSGYNLSGKLGDGVTTASQKAPVKIAISGVDQLDAGTGQTLALKTDGTLWSWGLNSNGQVGNGTTVAQKIPTQVITNTTAPLSGVVAIDAGRDVSMALTSDGSLYTWGFNGNGELGIGNTTTQKFPVLSNFPNLLY